MLEWIKQQPSLQGLPVIVMSSSDLPNKISRVMALGANSYFVKTGRPMNDLVKLVKQIPSLLRPPNQDF
ncbi:response regulator [Scytonema sp. NUACC21]